MSAPAAPQLVERLLSRIPEIYTRMDQQQEWLLRRFLSAVLEDVDTLDLLVNALRGERPIGPASPQPWGLAPDELAVWNANRASAWSTLADPVTAPAAWLPWMAQLVGAVLDPRSSEAEQRDTIRYATSGWRGGTRATIEDAARSALTGSRYVELIPHQAGAAAGTMWDVTLRTRTSETPDPTEVLATVIRKGAKPAGVRLWHVSFATSWDKVEALFPTWTDWEARTWDQIEEVGITYADVAENMAPGASFETNPDMAKWAGQIVGGGSAPTWPAAPNAGTGLDGQASGRLTKVGATGGMGVRSVVIIDARIIPGREYLLSISAKPSIAVPATMNVEWLTAGGAAISTTSVSVGTLTAAAWNRSLMTTRHTAPATAAQARLSAQYTGTVAAGTTVDHDAALFRLVTTTGG